MTLVELRIKPSKPYGDWIAMLKLMGYRSVGLDIPAQDALEFQKEAGTELLCFLLTTGGTAGEELPFLDSCPLGEANRRRKPPAILSVSVSDRVEDVDVFLGAHPNRVEALELNINGVRLGYERDPRGTFEWTARLARTASVKKVPILASSCALTPGELLTPLAKEALARMTKTGQGSVGIRRRRFMKRLEQAVTTRRRTGSS